jgi:U3 small nucleolar RNA-associated protein 7
MEDSKKYAYGPLTAKTAKGSKNHKRLKATMQETQDDIISAATSAAAAEVLLPSSDGFIETDKDNEKVYKLTQNTIRGAVDLNTAKQALDLKLPTFGPYRTKYSRNGRSMIFGGRRGHVAVMNAQKLGVTTELHLEEAVHDVQFLHNESLFAVAQDKYTYIYDNQGTEIHCMRKHERPFRLDFLPYHFLLTTVGQSGWVKWHDVSTGDYVAGFATGHGPTRVMTHNPTNAVTHLGHSNGVVTLWSPAAGKPLASMFAHKAPITDVAVDRGGHYMATAGMDGFMKVWDLRKFGCVHAFKPDKNCTSLDISDKGLLAMSCGRHVTILKDCFTRPTGVTYLKHEVKGCAGPRLSGGGNATASKGALASSVMVSNVKFRPYEDVLAVGHSHGVSTLIVPGAGEANFDSMENNPFADLKQTREAEIAGLLNKLKPEMIQLDASFIGGVDRDQEMRATEHREAMRTANANKGKGKGEDRHRKRGRNKISAKLRRKQKNVVDAQTLKLTNKLQDEKATRDRAEELRKNPNALEERERKKKEFSALKRFARK